MIVQRSSMLIASRLKQRIAERYGAKVTSTAQVYAAFPPPVTLLEAGGLGLPAQKEEWIRGLARAALDGLLTTEYLRSARPRGGPRRAARPPRRRPVLRRPHPHPRRGRPGRLPRRRAPPVRDPPRGVRPAGGRPARRLPQAGRRLAPVPLLGLLPVPRRRGTAQPTGHPPPRPPATPSCAEQPEPPRRGRGYPVAEEPLAATRPFDATGGEREGHGLGDEEHGRTGGERRVDGAHRRPWCRADRNAARPSPGRGGGTGAEQAGLRWTGIGEIETDRFDRAPEPGRADPFRRLRSGWPSCAAHGRYE